MSERTAEEFKAALRGIPTHILIKAMNFATPTTNWNGCSKQIIAETWARKDGKTQAINPQTIRFACEAMMRELQQTKEVNAAGPYVRMMVNALRDIEEGICDNPRERAKHVMEVIRANVR